jgi:hypothetical protein
MGFRLHRSAPEKGQGGHHNARLGWFGVLSFGLQHFHRDFQPGGLAHKPFLDVEAADNGSFALGLNLSEFHGVLGVFFFFELNGFRFLFHDLMLVDG